MDNSKRDGGLLGDKLDDKYDANYVQHHIKLPENPQDIPRIVGWSGPARSGTTALLFLLAGHNEVDRIYFQPQKTLMRFGYPSITLDAMDELVCMKEVFYSVGRKVVHDPIEILLKAGVPPEKITWIFMLRDPLQTFSSWEKNVGEGHDPRMFYFWQSHTIALWRKYKDSGVKAIPFVYELLEGREEFALGRLFTEADLDISTTGLEFNQKAISQKIIPGQAADEGYFQKYLEGSLVRGRYRYITNSYVVDRHKANEVVGICQKDYEAFMTEAQTTLGL